MFQYITKFVWCFGYEILCKLYWLALLHQAISVEKYLNPKQLQICTQGCRKVLAQDS